MIILEIYHGIYSQHARIGQEMVGLSGVQITLIVIISKYLEILMLTNKTSEQILNMLNKML